MERALSSLFPALDADSIAAVLASTDGVFSLEALEGLLAMLAEIAGPDGATSDARFSDSIRFVGDGDWASASAALPVLGSPPSTAPPRWIVIQSFPPASPLSLAQRAPLELLVGQVVCVLPAAEGDSLLIRSAVSAFHASVTSATGAAASSSSALALPPAYTDSTHTGGVFVVKDAGLFAIAAPALPSSAPTASGSDVDPFSRAAVFYAVSPAHRAARALDQLFDSFFWGWGLSPTSSTSAGSGVSSSASGISKSSASSAQQAAATGHDNHIASSATSAASNVLADSVGWTSRLEFSLVELLVSVDEVLLPMLESMRRMVPQEVCFDSSPSTKIVKITS
jgi:hypothetical protein